MVTSELIRQYSFFSGLTIGQLKEPSMIADEKTFEPRTLIFEECAAADKLYLLLEGNIDSSYRSINEMYAYTSPAKEFYAGSINPGEVYGISALIEPNTNNATARSSEKSRIIIMDAIGLWKSLEQDLQLAYNLTRQTVIVMMDRLISLRVQLAAT